ncbi:MAG: quinone-dependent dihydroorotate dehydrogenase [Bacteroidales bacterium]|jgi:dihydroorotate dehydrogenase|nr:quinone-dependent dihydroorotate dehydrogenase [Bacteroidales bacterium]
MYKFLIRPFLFLFNPERAHKIIFSLLRFSRHIPGLLPLIRLTYRVKTPTLERNLFGLNFKNPVGIAGGLDKNAECYNELACFGFSFIEIGSLTPKPQIGNPKPRCFRLVKDNAIINRMGINNFGVRNAIDNLRKHPPRDVIIAANISKNATTSNEEAADDYEKALTLMYDFADMTVLNISCPNVKDLTELQDIEMLSNILDRIITMRKFNDEYHPILLKLSPDIPFEQIDEIIDLVQKTGIDGIVATNTTRSREGLATQYDDVKNIGDGGLSGAPLFEKSLKMVRYIHDKTGGSIPIIGVGGIMTPEQAREMLDAGASLIEVYTGFIYNGPGYIKKILKHLRNVEKERALASTIENTPSSAK